MVKAPMINFNFCSHLITYGLVFIFTKKNTFQGMFLNSKKHI